MSSKIPERVGRWFSIVESRWNLWNLIVGSGLVASFALPAWAAHASEIFKEYAPFSWVVAGFCGALLWVIVAFIYAWGSRIRVRAVYDAKLLEKGSIINPLEMIFERKRISLDDFVLPSWTFIDGKTFVDCDLIGPANMYFLTLNMANPIRPPKVDAVWLAPSAKFNNGFIFNNCIFRNCSFQRITLFASVENYHLWKDNLNLNWIGITPTEDHLAERQRILSSDQTSTGQLGPKFSEERELLEHKPKPGTSDNVSTHQ